MIRKLAVISKGLVIDMAEYMTEQRRLLMRFLQCNPDRQYTAKQIYNALKNEKISLSAVYRNLACLEKEGSVRRAAGEENRESVYQYIDSDSCRDCLHFVCTKCGKTYHLKDSAAEEILNCVSSSDGFQVDKKKTVLQGLCKDCK